MNGKLVGRPATRAGILRGTGGAGTKPTATVPSGEVPGRTTQLMSASSQQRALC